MSTAKRCGATRPLLRRHLPLRQGQPRPPCQGRCTPRMRGRRYGYQPLFEYAVAPRLDRGLQDVDVLLLCVPFITLVPSQALPPWFSSRVTFKNDGEDEDKEDEVKKRVSSPTLKLPVEMVS
ncbi:hypothetical protein EJB05_47395 [Eragrostis curvula]|uniref:Uncharacterized protein n=1 Tax=Eragrostis curvula TaxID=38414 RepID=A0A5J9T7K3_9POAL|nr:hypothetical protein EJB05_47395 [Eragrostis curvula]